MTPLSWPTTRAAARKGRCWGRVLGRTRGVFIPCDRATHRWRPRSKPRLLSRVGRITTEAGRCLRRLSRNMPLQFRNRRRSPRGKALYQTLSHRPLEFQNLREILGPRQSRWLPRQPRAAEHVRFHPTANPVFVSGFAKNRNTAPVRMATFDCPRGSTRKPGAH
jgi:hypothetical protein